MRNRASVEVFGIGTYKLELHIGHTLLLHDVHMLSKFGIILFQLFVCLDSGSISISVVWVVRKHFTGREVCLDSPSTGYYRTFGLETLQNGC